MRLSRTLILGRIGGPAAPPVVLLEAPNGYGKSWLARHAVDGAARRLRGTLDPLRSSGTDRTIILDDAHLLPAEQIDELVEIIEDADEERRLIIAGRLAPIAVHDAVRLVDGLVLDAPALAVTAEEVTAADTGRSLDADAAARLVEVADGCIRIVAAALAEAGRDGPSDPVAVASQMVRATALSTQQALRPDETAVLALLARAPGLDGQLLERIGGAGFVDRCVAVGVPLRRLVTGELVLSLAAGFGSLPLTPSSATALADELVNRERPLDAISLLLDAGLHERAARSLTDLNESMAEAIEPRALLNLLARLGSLVENEPGLLLLRATAERNLGHVDQAADDIDKAGRVAGNAPPAVRHRVAVEAARARLTSGDVATAVHIAERALSQLGPGEERTYARAYDLLGQCAATGDGRTELQRAAECYLVAAAAWERCGELARARRTRCDLAMSALIPLGRLDEALSVLSQQLASSQMSDVERSWVLVMEGFALLHANRLDSAESRFDRVTDLGYLQENPRLVATAAWGHAMVAWRRDDRAGTIRHLASAENTALGEGDDVLGIPFLCDAATALGALGEIELAEQYLRRAEERRPLFRDQISTTRFLLDARQGRLGDVEATLRSTPPAEWWRVHLTAAYALAHSGDPAAASRAYEEAERELTALGIGDARSLGEALVADRLRDLLRPEAARPARPTAPAAPVVGPYVMVLDGPMTVREGERELPVPSGNPRRLLGVVAAYGGSASLDQISEAVWPGDPVDASRARLRNVLMRLRRAAGDLLVRSATGVRFAPGVGCDLHDFERRAADALASARADPDLAGRLAAEAVELAGGTAFAEFEYEEWAMSARRSVEQQLINLLDLLSVQAEDAGDLRAAQAYAERALRLDRYSDSRYVRLSELLAMQDRVAAAIAVLDDAAEVARELGGALPSTVSHRRNELVRRTASR